MFGPFVMLLLTGVLLFNGETVLSNWEMGVGWRMGLFALCLLLFSVSIGWGFVALSQDEDDGLPDMGLLARMSARSMGLVVLAACMIMVIGLMLALPGSVIASQIGQDGLPGEAYEYQSRNVAVVVEDVPDAAAIEADDPQINIGMTAESPELAEAEDDLQVAADLADAIGAGASTPPAIEDQAEIEAEMDRQPESSYQPVPSIGAQLVLIMTEILAIACGLAAIAGMALSLPMIAQDAGGDAPMRKSWQVSRGHRWKLSLPLLAGVLLIWGVSWAQGIIDGLGAAIPFAATIKAVLLALATGTWILASDRFVRQWRQPDLSDLTPERMAAKAAHPQESQAA